MRRFLVSLAAVFAAAPGASAASVTNGGFETGDFTGFTTIGDAAVVGDIGAGPAEGLFQALLTNASAADVTDATFSGAVTPAAIEAFLGLEAGTLDGLVDSESGSFGFATEGSAIAQEVTGLAGDVISFSANFLSDEDELDAAIFNDFSFFALVSDDLGTVAVEVLADAVDTVGKDSDTAFGFETGFFVGEVVLPADGTFTLGFGVLDVGDDERPSGLLVDAVVKTSSVVIPEPGTLTLAAAGLGACVASRRRRAPRVAGRRGGWSGRAAG